VVSGQYVVYEVIISVVTWLVQGCCGGQEVTVYVVVMQIVDVRVTLPE
jgi:hypothetical protein